MHAQSSRFLILSGLFVWFIGALLGINYLRLGWTLDHDGLSVMTGRLPFWDFTNLWGGGRMALYGHVDYLFDVDLYRRELRALLSPQMLDQEWSYPPSMLLIGAPLGSLPIFPAYFIWTGLTLICLILVARRFGLALNQQIIILLAPSVLLNVVFGQNGALTASLLLGGLLLAPSRPLASGILIGLLTIKPHLGLLVPFCLLAARNYRAMLAAALTIAVLIVVTAILFGWNSWLSFLGETSPMMRSIMEAAYPQGYQMNAMTFFVLARSLGFGVPAAYAIQFGCALVAVSVIIWLWSGRIAVDHAVRVAITGLLALCATPYGYTYDSIPLAVAVLVLGMNQLAPALLLAVGWLYPIMNHRIAMDYPSFGVLVPALLAAVAVFNLWRQTRKSSRPVCQDGVIAS